MFKSLALAAGLITSFSPAQTPRIRFFEASAPQVQPGTTITVRNDKPVTLTWNTTHADWVDIEGLIQPPAGSLTLDPGAYPGDTWTFTLTAHQSETGRTATAQVVVAICIQSNCDGGPLLGHGKGHGN